MDLAINILTGIFVFVAILMILVILMQRPKSEGLGAAFGGGVTENIFGAQTTNVLTKITGWFAAIFFLLCFALSILYAQKSNSPSNLTERVKKILPPAAATTSATPTATASPGTSSTATPSGSATPAGTAAPSVVPANSPAAVVPPTTSPAPPATSPAASVRPSATPSSTSSPKR